MARFGCAGGIALTLFATAFGCGPAHPAQPTTPSGIAASPVMGVARIERRELDSRPPINLLARAGDPTPGVALAIAHDHGSVGSVALSTLLVSRMRAQSVEVETRAHELGLEVFALVANATLADAFVRAAAAALAKPVVENDPAIAQVFEQLGTLRARSFAGPAEATVAGCSGELGIPPGAAVWEIRAIAGKLEAVRRAAYSSSVAAFAALGPPDFLDGVANALSKTRDWPSGDAVNDAWPERDFVGVDTASGGPRRLTVALRVPNADAALEAAHRLGATRSALVLGLGALAPGWQLERSSATARPRGACLRLDAVASSDPGPSARDVARASELMRQAADLELELVGAGAPGAALDASVLRPSDPRLAVSAAAWRALVGRQEAGSVRRFMSYSVPSSEQRIARDLPSAIESERALFSKPTLESRARVEAGQAEFWMLAASPCGASETRDDAGFGALVVRALAERTHSDSDVMLEPWISPDGIGLLAHSPARDAHETGPALASRVAAALGRALIGPKPSGTDLAAARAGLLEELGPGPRPGFWHALDAASSGRPAWLEPRGTFASLSMATRESVSARQRDLTSGPLRVAVLANDDAAQAENATATLERWLRPVRFDSKQCPKSQELRPRSGEFTIETTAQDPPEGAYVAVPLRPQAFGPTRAAAATIFLLNRRGGWLEQALSGAGLAASARARFQGGGHAAALVIEIRAVERTRDAVAQVRALLDRLAQGAATASDVALAEKEQNKLFTTLTLDPRRRIVNLWRGSDADPALDLASLRSFCGALRAESHVVVHVNASD